MTTDHSLPEEPRVQRAAKILGLAGLLPFWSLPVLVLGEAMFGADLAEALLQLVAVYGAIICSFMGGTRWGLAMRTPEAGAFAGLLGSVMPPLLAWLVVGLPSFGVSALQRPLTQLLLIAAFLAFQLFEDWRSAGKGLLSAWYIHLRMVIVANVVTAIVLTTLINSLTG